MKRSYSKLKDWVEQISQSWDVDVKVHKENDQIFFSTRDEHKTFKCGLTLNEAYLWFEGYVQGWTEAGRSNLA